jgi:hypothetical protein
MALLPRNNRKIASIGAPAPSVSSVIAGADPRMIADAAAGNVATSAALRMAPPPGPIGPEQIHKAIGILLEYQRGKANKDQQIVENHEWYMRRHWEYIRQKQAKPGEVEPTSAFLFNNLASKHADIMDNYPEASILPRERLDELDADELSSVVPVVFERNDYEKTYSDTGWHLLKSGTAAQGAFWDPDAENGLGEIVIRELDVLNLFWKPGIKDIQDSPHFFIASSVEHDSLKAQYPWMPDNPAQTITVVEYAHDESIDKTNMTVVIDWYYKKRSNSGKSVLHYVKFAGETLLYASENDPNYAERGFYDHGRYPVELEPLFPEEDAPTGFGLIDIMKEPQLYIDKLDEIIMRNAMMAGKKRWFVREDGSINENEYADWSKDFVHVKGSLDEKNIKEIEVSTLDAYIITHKQMKIDEQKETSANRDFSQGGVTGGVTAASAIAALQEAGNKNSRDINKGRYRTFQRINYIVIELIRQFYDEPRKFRIVGEDGAAKYIAYSNARIKAQPLQAAYPGAEPASRMPIFDIKVKAQRSNPFSKSAQNELALTMYKLQMFNPQQSEAALACLDMMDIEGKQKIIQKISENGKMFSLLSQIMMALQQLQMLRDGAPTPDTGGQKRMAADSSGQGAPA